MKQILALIMVISCGLIYSQNASFTSRIEKYFDDGSTCERAFYKDKIEIARIYYGDDGNRVKTTGNIPDNVVFTSYYDNGSIEREAIYKSNVYNGKIKFYYENGIISSEQTYLNGIQTGETKDYFDNGNVHIISKYSNDKKNGLSIVYYITGKKQFEVVWKDDAIDGYVKAFDENEKLQVVQHYKNNVIDGDFYQYYPNGKTKMYSFFNDGVEIKEKTKYYDENGLELPPAICVTAISYYSDYDTNEVSADNKYRNKLVEITGIVTGIKRSYSDEIYIELGVNNSFWGVDCYLAENQSEEAASVTKGQSITLRGYGDKKVISPRLQGCVIIK